MWIPAADDDCARWDDVRVKWESVAGKITDQCTKPTKPTKPTRKV